jgi:predicted secreted protein
VIHVVGLEFDEEHNGEVSFQISLFLKKLQAFTCSMPTVT